MPPPAKLPPAGSAPLVYRDRALLPDAGRRLGHRRPDLPLLHPGASRASRRENRWVPYDEEVEQIARRGLPAPVGHQLPRQPVDRGEDYTYANGVIGKHIIYNMEERQRVKIVDYVGSRSSIDEDRREAEGSRTSRSGSTRSSIPALDPQGRAASSASCCAEKGYQFAEVKPEIKEMPGGPKLVHLTFNIDEGPEGQDPRHRLRRQQGGQRRHAASGRMKENKEQWFLSFITGRGTYQEDQVRGGRRQGRRRTTATRATSRARVGQPELKYLEDSGDGKTRWVQLRDSGHRGRRATASASSTFDGNTVVKAEALRPLFKLEGGRLLQREGHPQGPREGARGLRRRRLLRVHRLSRSAARATQPARDGPARQRRAASPTCRRPHAAPTARRSST